MGDADLLDALRDCYEPVLKKNVVDLRLVRSATVRLDKEAPGAGIAGVPPRYLARVALYAPGTDEAVNAQVAAVVSNRLAGLAWVSRAEVEMVAAVFPILR